MSAGEARALEEAVDEAYYDGGSCEACGEFHAAQFLAALAARGYAVVAAESTSANVENPLAHPRETR